MWKAMQPLPWKTAPDQGVNHVGSELKPHSTRPRYVRSPHVQRQHRESRAEHVARD